MNVYSGKIPHLSNLTVCHWEYLNFFNRRASCPWAYCYRASAAESKYNIKCLQFWYNTDSAEAGLGVKAASGFDGELFYFKSKFHARKWNHFCVSWQLQENSGKVEIFLNGYRIGSETFTSKATANGIKGSDEVFESYFILGQEPDVIGPPYEEADLFRGKITEVNFWNKILDEKTILKLGTCQIFPQGNIISWNKDQFNITQARVISLPDKASLCKPKKNLAIFPEKKNLEDATTLCAAHGGKIFTPKNEEENKRLVDILLTKQDKCIDVNEDFISF